MSLAKSRFPDSQLTPSAAWQSPGITACLMSLAGAVFILAFLYGAMLLLSAYKAAYIEQELKAAIERQDLFSIPPGIDAKWDAQDKEIVNRLMQLSNAVRSSDFRNALIILQRMPLKAEGLEATRSEQLTEVLKHLLSKQSELLSLPAAVQKETTSESPSLEQDAEDAQAAAKSALENDIQSSREAALLLCKELMLARAQQNISPLAKYLYQTLRTPAQRFNYQLPVL